MSKHKKCDCGNDCIPIRPKEIMFSFKGIDVRIWNWNRMEYSNKCSWCLGEIENSRIEEFAKENYDAGYERGYSEAAHE